MINNLFQKSIKIGSKTLLAFMTYIFLNKLAQLMPKNVRSMTVANKVFLEENKTIINVIIFVNNFIVTVISLLLLLLLSYHN